LIAVQGLNRSTAEAEYTSKLRSVSIPA